MGLFNRKPKTVPVDIQATEGLPSKTEIDSLLSGRSLVESITGLINGFETYQEQTDALYQKYNGFDDWGCQQTRAVIDIRSAFIGGEGLSVSCTNDATSAWIEDFLKANKLQGSNFINAIKSSEMAGQTLLVLDTKDDKVVVRRLRYNAKTELKVVYSDKRFNDDIVLIKLKKGGESTALNIKNYIYIRTGGDDSNNFGPTTRVGVVLTDLENYDRALKDMRRNNYIFARVTPTFEVDTDSEAKTLKKTLQSMSWKIGQAFIGKARFTYQSPPTTAYENLVSEMTATLKSIAATTGIPVHWLGHVDLMSNRATADALYETIKNATINERLIWEEAMYDLIVKAQEMYIDNGGELELNLDFEIKIPLIDYAGFKDKVSALSQAFADSAISMDDYRNELPGIDPLKTKKAVEAEEKEAQAKLVKMGVQPTNIEEGDSDDGNEDDETKS